LLLARAEALLAERTLMRLLWVVPRFGSATVGGAERLVQALALRALNDGFHVEVATTCASDHATWENVLDAGVSDEEGLRVHRFPVSMRDAELFEAIHRALRVRRLSYAEELMWLANSVWSAEMHDFLRATHESYDLLLFAPYLFGTTIWGAQIAPRQSALMPCLHDEPYAYLTTVRRVMAEVKGCIFNSEAEEQLCRRLTPLRVGGVVGMGFDAPSAPPPLGFRERHDLDRFLLYAGRLEEGKRVDVAVAYAVRYAAERRQAPKLVLIGSGSYQVPREASHAVLSLGFLDEADKRAAYAEALALVHPSHLESLSIVLLEAWLEGTPALVAAGSEVLRDHCVRSGGGLLFASFADYRDAVDRLMREESLPQELGTAGRKYVLAKYNWDSVSERFRATVEQLAA
jgi:glycosyltransferase involved in cell wall biosynthesis